MGAAWSAAPALLGAAASTTVAAAGAAAGAAASAAHYAYRRAAAAAGGRPPAPACSAGEVADSVDKLQVSLEKLAEKLEHMARHAAACGEEARRLYRAGRHGSATHQLRLQKLYAAEARKLECLRFNIESNMLHMESVGVIMETVATIKDTSEHFQLVHRQVDVDQLEDTVEQLMEQRDNSADLQSILTNATPEIYDDDTLLRELQAMEDDENNTPAPPPCLPAPPTHAVAAAPPRPAPPARAPQAASPRDAVAQ